MKNYYYLYETINLSNNRKYIGQHCTHKMKDGYTGTSKELNDAIANGDKYIVKILKHFTNIFDLGDAEYEEINKRNCIKDKTYYNKSNRRSYNYNFENGLSETYRKKVSVGTKKSMTPEVCEKISKAIIGNKNALGHKQTSWNKGLTKELDKRVKSGMIGKKHSQETKQKISISSSKPRKPLSEETKNKITESLKKYHKNNGKLHN